MQNNIANLFEKNSLKAKEEFQFIDIWFDYKFEIDEPVEEPVNMEKFGDYMDSRGIKISMNNLIPFFVAAGKADNFKEFLKIEFEKIPTKINFSL